MTYFIFFNLIYNHEFNPPLYTELDKEQAGKKKPLFFKRIDKDHKQWPDLQMMISLTYHFLVLCVSVTTHESVSVSGNCLPMPVYTPVDSILVIPIIKTQADGTVVNISTMK